jgi:hypothetical protein
VYDAFILLGRAHNMAGAKSQETVAGRGPMCYVGKMQHISASQIKTFRSCGRKWFLERTDPGERTVGAAAALGKQVHATIEQALLTGDVALLDTEPVLNEAVWIRDLIRGGGAVTADMVERPVRLEDFAVPIIGFIDLVLRTAPDEITVVDHKTTSAWRYMQTPEQLAVDPQALIYTYAMALAYPEVERFVFMHHVLLTKGGPKPERLVQVTFTRAEVLAHADELARQIADMAAVMTIGVADDVAGAYNDACWAYGGCAFKSRCYAKQEVGEVTMSSIFGGGAAVAQAVGPRVVYKDCLPSGAVIVPWATFVEPVVKEYCAKADVSSHLTVPYEKGVRQVAEAVRAAVIGGTLPWPADGVFINSADPTANLFCALAGREFTIVAPVR